MDLFNERLEDFKFEAENILIKKQNWVSRLSATQGLYEQYIFLAERDEMGIWIYSHNFPISEAKEFRKASTGMVIYLPFSIIDLSKL